MNNKKRFILMITLIVLLFCSCNKSNESENLESEQISFSWWGYDLRNKYINDALSVFSESNPSIDLKTEFNEYDQYKRKIFIELESGNNSDVMMLDYGWLPKYSDENEYDKFYDLNELADNDYIDLSCFTEDQLSYGTVNGKLNAIPISLSAKTYIYNKDIFDEYELSIPKTWNDLFEVAEKMSKYDIYPLEIDLSSAWLMSVCYIEQLKGKSVFNDNNELGFEKDDFEELFMFYNDLIEKKVCKNFIDSDNTDFICDKAAGTLYWSSNIEYNVMPVLREGKNIVVGDYIAFDNKKPLCWYIKPTGMYCIKKDTKNVKEALNLVDFLIKSREMAEFQGTEMGIPASKSSLETLDANGKIKGISYDVYSKMKENEEKNLIKKMNFNLDNPDILEEFKNSINNIYYENEKIEDEADSFYDKVVEIIKKE